MTPSELAAVVARVCERLRLDYFVTGSVGSSYYGIPRLTHDVDIVIELPSWKAKEFCAAFPAPDFYADPDTALRAAMQGDQFNILHFPSGLKVDVLIFTDTPHNESRLSRSRLVRFPSGDQVRMASPEDIILKKLAYYREGQSEKHMTDISGIVREVPGLDLRYIADWALRTGVQTEWRAIVDRLRLPDVGPGGAL